MFICGRDSERRWWWLSSQKFTVYRCQYRRFQACIALTMLAILLSTVGKMLSSLVTTIVYLQTWLGRHSRNDWSIDARNDVKPHPFDLVKGKLRFYEILVSIYRTWYMFMRLRQCAFVNEVTSDYSASDLNIFSDVIQTNATTNIQHPTAQ